MCANIHTVLGNKAVEYSSKQDRLHNFDKAKDIFRCKTKEFALLGMLNKHLVSVIDMIMKHEKEGVLPEEKILDEKIGDSINYFILLKACFMDDIISANKNRCSNIPTIPHTQSTRKAAAVSYTRNKLRPVLVYLEQQGCKNIIKMIEDIFIQEEKKRDCDPDDEMIKTIIKILETLKLPDNIPIAKYKFLTMAEIRDEIVKDLKGGVYGCR